MVQMVLQEKPETTTGPAVKKDVRDARKLIGFLFPPIVLPDVGMPIPWRAAHGESMNRSLSDLAREVAYADAWRNVSKLAKLVRKCMETPHSEPGAGSQTFLLERDEKRMLLSIEQTQGAQGVRIRHQLIDDAEVPPGEIEIRFTWETSAE